MANHKHGQHSSIPPNEMEDANLNMANEHTSLLSPDSVPYPHGTFGERLGDEEIDPNEFDLMLSRSPSYTTGLGVEGESQETAMLRNSRRQSTGRGPRRASRASTRRKSLASSIGSDQDAIPEVENEDDEELSQKSPYLAGVSVAKFWLIFANVLACYFVACFDSTIMVSSHPVITSYFHSSNSASWLSTAFLLTSTAFQPLFGRLSDTVGRKSPYVFTITIFLLSTLWCGLAQSMTSFILARALCGLGAGGMMSLGSIITSDLVPIEIRGAYQSYINIVFGVGATLGAALGGAIADSLGWRWEFGIQIPFLVVCLVNACLTIPSDIGIANGVKQKSLWEAMKVFDFKGSILLTTSITFLILGLNLGGNVFPWSHPIVITALVIFGVGFPLFIFVESRVPLPIMPLKLVLRNPQAGLILSNSIAAIVTNAVTFNIPLFFQAVLLESATSSGLRLIVPSLSASIVGVAIGFIITWTRELKWPLIAGAVMFIIGTVGLIFMERGLQDWMYLLFLVPSSMGQGFLFPGSFIAVLAVSEQAEQAVVTSTLILWRSLGMVMGVASSSLVLQNALLIYLNENITGPDKYQVIEEVRKSVQAIADLEPRSREQVIDSYAAALRATFIMSAVLSAITLLIIVYIRLPKLGHRK
ncbi:hypothetical protein B7494_g51 [Chlorociboria aeruginascens]|nr:hypothetical protein B7494_g51 [Chlorociboria aeruginascens]